MRETGLFTHGRVALSSKIISMCTPGVAVPCLSDAGQGREMPLRHRTIGFSRARTLALPCSQPHISYHTLSPDCEHSTFTLPRDNDPSAGDHPHFCLFPRRDYLCQLPLFHRTSDFRRTYHPFVVSMPFLSTSFHVTFHDVRTKTFSTHVTT